MKCIYSHKEQVLISERFISELLKLAALRGENTDNSKRHRSNSYHDVFEEIEDDLLRISAAIKHNSFREEREWRAVSKIVNNYVAEPIEYREGESTLVPYIRFNLPSAPDRHIDLEKVYVGPTPRATNSMASVSNFLSRSKASPRQGTEYCRTPYRTY